MSDEVELLSRELQRSISHLQLPVYMCMCDLRFNHTPHVNSQAGELQRACLVMNGLVRFTCPYNDTSREVQEARINRSSKAAQGESEAQHLCRPDSGQRAGSRGSSFGMRISLGVNFVDFRW